MAMKSRQPSPETDLVINFENVQPTFVSSSMQDNFLVNEPGLATTIANNATSADNSSFYQLSSAELIIFSVIYALTILTSVIGNALVIWIVLRTRRVRQSNTNYFIINLALVDLFIMIFNLPWTFIYTVNGNVWPWGTLWCKLAWSIGTAAMSSNAFTFAAIMVDRYQAIANPLHKYVERRRRVIIALVLIWVLSFITGLPTLIGYETEFSDGQVPRYVCKNNWSPLTEYIHMLGLVAIQLVIPLAITLVAYRLIRLKLCDSTAIGDSSVAEAAAIRKKRRVVQMMMVVVVTFTICVFPNNVFVLLLNWPSSTLRSFFGTIDHARNVLRAFLIFYWLAMSNSMWNPFIYAYWNTTFRLGFKYAFRWLPCVVWDIDVDAPKLFDQRRTFSTVTNRGNSMIQRNPVTPQASAATQQRRSFLLSQHTSLLKNGSLPPAIDSSSFDVPLQHETLNNLYNIGRPTLRRFDRSFSEDDQI